MFLRDHHHSHHGHHHHHHHHSGSSVSSSTHGGEQPRHKPGGGGGEHLRSGDKSGPVGSSRDGTSNKFKMKKQINGRERKRMHDLNLAMDGLREVMPYAHGPSVRKLSKIATLLLARNYILMLNSSLDEMKRLVGEIYGGQHSAFHCGTVTHAGGHAGGTGRRRRRRGRRGRRRRAPGAPSPRQRAVLLHVLHAERRAARAHVHPGPALADEGLRARGAPRASAGLRLPALGRAAVPLHHLPGASSAHPRHLHGPHETHSGGQRRDEMMAGRRAQVAAVNREIREAGGVRLLLHVAVLSVFLLALRGKVFLSSW
ncbi:unnamed protein product [Tetraodon nigroviridis]|uniref:(spotted green pufferfish) hypothetical protein n=1 Tax=Tetraodon nigroviridis TaxID=99883 RepID=Q4RNI4_TETNG|nr:unnamed protein product [Tetraodon nigroviridis]